MMARLVDAVRQSDRAKTKRQSFIGSDSEASEEAEWRSVESGSNVTREAARVATCHVERNPGDLFWKLFSRQFPSARRLGRNAPVVRPELTAHDFWASIPACRARHGGNAVPSANGRTAPHCPGL